MAKESGPSTALLVALAALGLLTAVYGRATGTAQAPGRLPGSRHDITPGSEKRAVETNIAGREATTPLEIPPSGWVTVFKRVAVGFNDDRLMTEAAGVTFYTLLAIFPAIATLISLFGLFADPAVVNDQLQNLQGVLPGGGLDIITSQVKSLTSNGRQALHAGVLIGLFTSLWSSNQGIKGLFDALNVVYHEKEKRGFVWRTVITLGFTLGAIVFILLAMGAIIVVPLIISFFGLGSWATALLASARWPALMVVLGLFLAAVYRFGPSRTQARWQWVSYGSAFAAVVWLLASIGFSYYVANFGSYNKTYGSLGAAIGFMTWIWISTIIVLVGGELNAELEQQTWHDTTVGPPKPMGSRGAYKADVKL
jgi:membrane protein